MLKRDKLGSHPLASGTSLLLVCQEYLAISSTPNPHVGDYKGRIGQSPPIRPGAIGLLIGIECSRVRDRPWMYLTSFITTRIGIELAAVQRKLLDYVVVGLQLTRLGLSM